MMTERPESDRLVIDEIRAERFGGLDGVTVPLGTAGLVVVAGLNESGKSSLSELLAWLLVGPFGTGEDARRFGDARDTLAGHVDGSFRGQDFRSAGSFTLLKSGAPNDRGMEITLGEQRFDAAGWRGLLSGIDDTTLRAVYRMWGADLHDGDRVSEQIEQTALGGIPGSGGVVALRAELESSVKSAITSRAAGAYSFWSLQRDRNDLTSKMAAIRAHADEYAELQREQNGIRADVERSDDVTLAVRRDIAAREALLAIADERRRLAEVRQEMGDLEVVPDAWSAIVASPDHLNSAVGALEAAEAAVEKASDELRTARDTAGLTAEEVAVITVAQPHVVSVTALREKLATARGELDRSEASARQHRLALDDLERELNDARAVAGGTTVEHLRALPLGNDDHVAVNAEIALWAAAHGSVTSEADKVAERERGLDEAEQNALREREAWDRFGAGSTAQEWLRTGGTTVGPSQPHGRRPDLWMFAIAAAVSAAASFVVPRFVWAAVTVAAFATAFVVARSRWGSHGAGDDSASSEAPSETVRDAAEAVVRSEGLVDDAARNLASSRGDLEGAVRRREAAERSARERAQAAGVTLGSGPAESTVQLEAVVAAVSALAKFDSASSASEEAATSLDSRRATVEALAAEMRVLLDECGVPDRVPVDTAPEVIELYQAVSSARAAQHSAQGEFDSAVAAYRSILEPVETQIAGLTREAIVARCGALVAVAARRHELEQTEKTYDRLIANRMGDDERALELQGDGRPVETLRFEKERSEERLAELETERSGRLERVGRIDERLDAIARESELARLSSEAGSLQDAANDRVVEGAARAVALRLLTQVAEEQRQANQPALVQRASELLAQVQSEWERILVSHDGSTAEISVRSDDGNEVSLHQLSTGARALVHLALRLAIADQDADKRGFRFPIICDDPLVHLDDQRAPLVLPLLAAAAERGHQVVLFTCHGRTVRAAESVGAHIVPLAGGIG